VRPSGGFALGTSGETPYRSLTATGGDSYTNRTRLACNLVLIGVPTVFLLIVGRYLPVAKLLTPPWTALPTFSPLTWIGKEFLTDCRIPITTTNRPDERKPVAPAAFSDIFGTLTGVRLLRESQKSGTLAKDAHSTEQG